MVLKNKTQKTTLTKDLKEAKTLTEKFLGLHLKNNPRSLLFKTRFGIHTFLLSSPIDVLVLDSEKIVKKRKTLEPNSIFTYNIKYTTVIELPAGTIKRSKTDIGNKLEIEL